jgi:hypothetical protein
VVAKVVVVYAIVIDAAPQEELCLSFKLLLPNLSYLFCVRACGNHSVYPTGLQVNFSIVNTCTPLPPFSLCFSPLNFQVLPYNLSAWWRSGVNGMARALRLVLGRAQASLAGTVLFAHLAATPHAVSGVVVGGIALLSLLCGIYAILFYFFNIISGAT